MRWHYLPYCRLYDVSSHVACFIARAAAVAGGAGDGAVVGAEGGFFVAVGWLGLAKFEVVGANLTLFIKTGIFTIFSPLIFLSIYCKTLLKLWHCSDIIFQKNITDQGLEIHFGVNIEAFVVYALKRLVRNNCRYFVKAADFAPILY